jgi:sugar phosphate isomerase/epimerase
MRWYISSHCSAKPRIGDALRELADAGFTAIELTGGTAYYEGVVEDVEAVRAEYGLSFAVHNYFPPQRNEFVLNPATANPLSRKRVVEFVRAAMRLSKRWGNGVYGMHPGFLCEMSPELRDRYFVACERVPRGHALFYAMLDELHAIAVEEGISLAIENLAPRTAEDRFSFLCDDQEIAEFLRFCAKKNRLGILLDLAHLGVSASVLGFDRDVAVRGIFEAHAGMIRELHLSEHSESVDRHGLTQRGSWQLEVLKTYRDRLRGLAVVFEWHHCDPAVARKEFLAIIESVEGA